MMACIVIIIGIVFSIRYTLKKIQKSKKRNYLIAAIIIIGFIILRLISGPAIESIEAVEPAKTGFLGGLGMPILFSWIVGAFFAGGLAYVIGKIALGLRADYLAIATLLIAEIIVSIIKHEDWLARGVKNVIGLKRPVPYEVDLQATPWFINLVEKFNAGKSTYAEERYSGEALRIYGVLEKRLNNIFIREHFYTCIFTIADFKSVTNFGLKA